MKNVVVIFLTMIFMGSAFAACGLNSTQECVTKESCEGLSTDTKKFEFNEKSRVKCMSKDGAVETTCLQANSSTGAKASVEGDSDTSRGTRGTSGTSR